jgi:hypothetical protein
MAWRALTEVAAGLARSVDVRATGLDPGDRDRDFVQLLRTDLYEAWLIAWGPAGTLELHDHGGSVGAVQLVDGALVETYSDSCIRHALRTRALTPGRTITVPKTRVHEVWNPGPETALSVHVYSPPLTSMTFYDVGSSERELVGSGQQRSGVLL